MGNDLSNWMKVGNITIAGKHRHQFINLDIFFKGLERFKFFPSFNNTVYNEKYYPSLWLHFVLTTQRFILPLGKHPPLLEFHFGVFVSHECMRVLVQEISIAALTKEEYNVFIYHNNKHSCKMDHKNIDMKISVTNVSAVIEK